MKVNAKREGESSPIGCRHVTAAIAARIGGRTL